MSTSHRVKGSGRQITNKLNKLDNSDSNNATVLLKVHLTPLTHLRKPGDAMSSERWRQCHFWPAFQGSDIWVENWIWRPEGRVFPMVQRSLGGRWENQRDLAQLGSEQHETRSAISQGPDYPVKKYGIHFLFYLGCSGESLICGQSNAG